jgi:hypothetical protein
VLPDDKYSTARRQRYSPCRLRQLCFLIFGKSLVDGGVEVGCDAMAL